MFCWGNSPNGELGVGGTETETFGLPYLNKHFQNVRVQTMACGYNHTVAVLDNGHAVSFGANEYGQLGQRESEKRPGLVRSLSELRCVRLAACGGRHSLFLTTNSEVYACGDNSMGQLGVGDREQRSTPRQVHRLDKEQVIQVACGKFHSLALTRGSLILSWGSNEQGQLGTGSMDNSCVCPNPIPILQSLFIAQISSGAAYSFALSSSGSLFAWGRNTFGQLGLGDTRDRQTPVLVESIQNKFVVSVRGGEEHSVLLTREGAVFSFGCGVYGQLGHDSNANQLTPKQIFELMDCAVTQIACGRMHTLISTRNHGGIRAFGLNANGQIGARHPALNSIHTPVQVGRQVVAQDATFQDSASILWEKSHRIYAGGDQSFLTVFPSGDGHMLDMRTRYYWMPELLTSGYLKSILDAIPLKSNPADISASVNLLVRVFSSPSLLSGSFLSQNPHRTSLIQDDTLPGLDLDTFCSTLQHPHLSKDKNIVPLLCDAVGKLLASLHTPLYHPESLRVFFLAPPLLCTAEPSLASSLLPVYLESFLSLGEQYIHILGVWYNRVGTQHLLQLVTLVVGFIQQIVVKRSTEEIVQKLVVTAMNALRYINSFNLYSQIPHQAFYIRNLPKYVDFFETYDRFVNKYSQFSFCDFPFVLDEVAKTILLSISNIFQMKFEMQHSGVHMKSPKNFLIVVSRRNIIQDTLNVLTVTQVEQEIRKPLIVQFQGEPGQDEGGVKKEFFMILVRDIMSPSYGMLKPDDESNLLWFLGHSFENPKLFELLGTICGLAIYNEVIINLPFPLALYKKLLGVKIDLSDLIELHPSLGHSMKSILEYEGGNFEEDFALTFEISQEQYGQIVTINLIEEGADKQVTINTRKLFVEKYIDYIFNKSVQQQYSAFARGFFMVCKSPIIQMFHPVELRLVICGNPEYDFSELEQHTIYGGGYHKHHRTIVIFWVTIHSFTSDLKRRFLSFLSGSDRVPIGGLASLKFRIDNVYGGVNCERLPVAHTCFNILALPPYNDKTVMRTKLMQAINFSEGFLLA